MTHIKICGITNLDDALVAVEAGADLLGFNFYLRSPRYISPSSARVIINSLPSSVLTVGVFVNEADPETVMEKAEEARVGAIQLHGNESPEFCRGLRERYVIKALRINPDFSPEQATEFEVPAILLDAFSTTAFGGTGETFDWSVARATREIVSNLFLAGGLSSSNVAEAICAVEPYAVDVCSSLELKPGRKDAERVRAFIAAARAC